MDSAALFHAGTDPADAIAGSYFKQATAPRIDTDATVYHTIRSQHPGINVTTVSQYNANLRAYAAAGHAEVLTLEQKERSWPSTHKWTKYVPPTKRLDGGSGHLVEQIFFEKYLYRWKDFEFLVYFVKGYKNTYEEPSNQYILGEEGPINSLISTIGIFTSLIHKEIWVFDNGWWAKDASLYESVMKSSWDDVILDRSLKEDLSGTIARFYNSREQYNKLRVPWKRGIIFYGPPGNGKTISIKATMHSLYERSPPVPTLYVKTLNSSAGPEYSISLIFEKARREAPCFLVFEDLDSIVTDQVRSFFLNAIDGLAENEGILMVGSTNHLDRLDPGISKRPSRFDRKYLFPNPNFDQRAKYCHYWQKKLKDNDDIDFPDKLCPAIAKITENFSFAYIQEAFVSALLAIANARDTLVDGKDDMGRLQDKWEMLEMDDPEDTPIDEDKDLEKYVLWRHIKVEIETLKKEISVGSEAV